MISLDALHSSKNYLFVNSMFNVCYVAGWARNIERDGNKTKFLIQQTNDLRSAVPVELSPGDNLPGDVREYMPIKIIGHVHGDRQPDGNRISVIRALYIDRPTLLDMPGHDAFNKYPKDPADSSSFRPIETNGDKLARGANVVNVAGFVAGMIMMLNQKGEPEHDCLVVLLRQHEDKNKIIPCRLYGHRAKMYKDRARIGDPVLIKGMLRSKEETVKVEGGEEAKRRNTYIRFDHLRGVLIPDEITVYPEWAEEMGKTAKKTQQIDPEAALQQIGTATIAPSIALVPAPANLP